MQPEMTDRLRRLQQRAERLGRLAGELRAVTPAVQEGRDTSGYVSVVLGPERLPVEIRIRDRWQERLDPARLGPAVMEANTDSLLGGMLVGAHRLDESGWWRRQQDADSIDWPTATPARVPLPAARTGRAPDDPELNERVLRFARAARERAVRPSPESVEGADDSGAVIIRLDPGGLIDCRIDETWARHRDGGTIGVRISQAVRRASAGLVSPRSAFSEAAAIVEDALSALQSLADTDPTRGVVR